MTQHLPDIDIPVQASHADHPNWELILKGIATKPEHLFMWFLLISLMFVFLSLMWGWHKSRSNKFDIMDLISTDGRLDESKLTRFIAFVISSWGFIWLLTTEKLSEWFFMGYMAAWVGNALFSRYLKQRDKEIDKTFEIEDKAVRGGWKPRRNRFSHKNDIEPYDPENEEEGDDTEYLPPANNKDRQTG